jgi:hypothetical protein
MFGHVSRVGNQENGTHTRTPQILRPPPDMVHDDCMLQSLELWEGVPR